MIDYRFFSNRKEEFKKRKNRRELKIIESSSMRGVRNRHTKNRSIKYLASIISSNLLWYLFPRTYVPKEALNKQHAMSAALKS